MRTQPDYPRVTAAIEIAVDWWKQWNRKYDIDSVMERVANPAPVSTTAGANSSAG